MINAPKILEKDEFIKGILVGDSKILNRFYALYFDRVANFILQNKGSLEDAKDVFQDGIMILYQQTQKSDFQLEHALFTYFYAICKRVWFQKLRRNKKMMALSPNKDVIADDSEIETIIHERNKQQLFFSKLSLLKPACQQILQLFFEKKSMDEIANKLDFGSAGYAKKKKYKCQKELLNLVKKDATYKELYG